MVDVPPSPAPSLHATAHAERSAFAGATGRELESRVYHRLHSHFHPPSLVR